MRADLAVIEGARAQAEIGAATEAFKLTVTHAGADHQIGHAGVMFARQVAAVGARIGDQLMTLVKRLTGVEDFLGGQAKTARGIDLQRRERIGQRRGL